jgi:hypothetical protein
LDKDEKELTMFGNAAKFAGPFPEVGAALESPWGCELIVVAPSTIRDGLPASRRGGRRDGLLASRRGGKKTASVFGFGKAIDFVEPILVAM